MKNLLTVVYASIILFLFCCTANAQPAYDTVSFESPSTKIVIDSTGGNLWQIGRPQKLFFDTAHSGLNVIVTDTLNSYPPNDTSSFIYIIRNPFTQTCLTCMEFWHKYDMDTLADKGLIDASYDGGNSWIIVKDTFIQHFSSNFFWYYDYHASTGNTTPHPLTTTGKSDGWILSAFCWQWFLPVSQDTIIANPDSLLVRFTFISDSIADNKEGWMIDDILTTSGGLEICSGTKESSLDWRVTIYPNPFSTETILETEEPFQNVTLTMYNSLGQKVQQLKNVSGTSVVLQRDNLPGGLYFLQLSQDNSILRTMRLLIAEH